MQYIGDKQIIKKYVGDTLILKQYQGETLVYEDGGSTGSSVVFTLSPNNHSFAWDELTPFTFQVYSNTPYTYEAVNVLDERVPITSTTPTFFDVTGTPATGITTFQVAPLTQYISGETEGVARIGHIVFTYDEGNRTKSFIIRQTPKPQIKWVELNSIDNTVPFDAIAWDVNYQMQRLDSWVSEVSGMTSENLSWSDGNSSATGWWAAHRWNYDNYSWSFLAENLGWDIPDVQYGFSVKDADRTTLPLQTLAVEDVGSVSANVLYFAGWQNEVPCYGAYQNPSNYENGIYVRING